MQPHHREDLLESVVKVLRRKFAGAGAVFALLVSSMAPAQANLIPKTFIALANSPLLAKPGIIVIDLATDQTLFANQPDTLRAPASVLKLVSMATALHNLGGETVFHTGMFTTNKNDTYLLIGESDPWLTASAFEAKKYHRAFSPSLINALLAAHPGQRTFSIDYAGVYGKDISIIKRYFSGRATLNFHLLPSVAVAKKEADIKLAGIASPTLNEIVQFTLLWSDNVLADRLARLASRSLGFAGDAQGIQAAFEETLAYLGVETAGLDVKDGNGLSKENKISVRTVAQLLLHIKEDPEFKVIYEGLPVAGISGTLKSRFVTDSPNAVGLVRAKTGWINGTVSLAGFVTVGDSQYVFTVIADHVKQTEYSRQLARETIDKMLGTIARPALSH